MEVYCYYLFYILFYMCLSPHVVHKGKQEISVGERHLYNETRSDRENHEIQKVTKQEPRSPKLDPNGHEGGLPGHPHGPTGLAQLCLTSRFVHGQVFIPYDLFSPISLSVSNRIENPLTNNFKTWGKIISVMTWIDSHNTFPRRSLATVGNLFLGTPCCLSCCGMRYSRIMRAWFLMSRY